MRAGPTKKKRGATTSAQNQVLLRALAGAFLLLALRVEPAAARAAYAASSIDFAKQRASSANFKLELFDARANATIALHGAGQACAAPPACPCPAPAHSTPYPKPPALRAGREPAGDVIIFSQYYS